ncbi:alpha/beta hydrolase family protein [Sphingomonas sp. Y38-1Y]|uniref:alpha/beta hydrolase family protein n=1 Tax=Sphingomonas sp. Y38-1Y TaxID=3078265 RepID=UPI0028ECE365|nr:alpha/beta fold hydrolase [Sphingomonas sp. Y38-1Y]
MRGMSLGLAGLLLMAAAPQEMSPQDIDKLPRSKADFVHRYGPAPMQFGELRVPKGKGPFPVAILFHGGCFLRAYEGLDGTAPIATALAAKGIATWNVEYRAIGDAGGGWPGSYQDWAAGADALRAVARRYPLDLSRVIVVGHSAGAPAAAFVAARPKLSGDARGRDPIRVRAAVIVDGPPDLSGLEGRDEAICGQPVLKALMGGTQAEQPARYRSVSPAAHLPLGVPTYLVSASPVLAPDIVAKWRAQAEAKGDRVTVIEPKGGDHFNIIAPGRPQWTETEALIERALALK